MKYKTGSFVVFIAFCFTFMQPCLVRIVHAVEERENATTRLQRAVAPSNINPVERFSKIYAQDYEFTITTIEGSDLVRQPLQVNHEGLLRMVRRQFKSRNTAEQKKGLFLRFDVSGYQFITPMQAKEAFDTYRIDMDRTPPEVRSKSPLLVLLKEDMLYFLNGSCQFSPVNLTEIENALIKAVFQEKQPGASHRLKKLCGGSLE